MKKLIFISIILFAITSCITPESTAEASYFEPAEPGQIIWKEQWKGSVAGIYHPDKKVIEWRTSWKSGIAVVYNPHTKKAEWRTRWHGGIAGVYNPDTKEVEWKDSWHHGVACECWYSLHVLDYLSDASALNVFQKKQ